MAPATVWRDRAAMLETEAEYAGAGLDTRDPLTSLRHLKGGKVAPLKPLLSQPRDLQPPSQDQALMQVSVGRGEGRQAFALGRRQAFASPRSTPPTTPSRTLHGIAEHTTAEPASEHEPSSVTQHEKLGFRGESSFRASRALVSAWEPEPPEARPPSSPRRSTLRFSREPEAERFLLADGRKVPASSSPCLWPPPHLISSARSSRLSPS